MKIVSIPFGQLHEAPWNPNHMDKPMLSRLARSITRYGLVGPLVVRSMVDSTWEVLSGNQRLQVLRELGWREAPCIVTQLDDAHARLLAQALNHIAGEDDLGLRAEVVRDVLARLPESEVLDLLPETPAGLAALFSLGQQDIAEYLNVQQRALGARLHHFNVQLTSAQIQVVNQALDRVANDMTGRRNNPNRRGAALYGLCHDYLEKGGIV